MLAIPARAVPALLSMLLLLGAPASAPGQTGTTTVVGRVTAAGTGTAIAGVTVRVLGTDRVAYTEEDGRYRITRLRPGQRTLAFETLGYRSRVIDAELASGEITTLDIQLSRAPLALEGVVVTSQKRQQAVQDVPITVTVHDGDFLESAGIGQFDILSSYTPGLEVQIQSPNNPGFVVRGITSDDGDARVESRVSVFQDGVSISKARGSVVELFDLERVEVLKGPQGTLFGRGAEIGAVHLIQNKARNERSAELTVGPGSYGHWFAEGHVNSPLVEDRLFARFAGLYDARDGYVDNLAGTDLNGKETLALRGLLRWAPDELTDLDLIVNWQRDTPPGTAFKSGV
ncbi:MAG: TonB-dependent receptor, partial [Longimicrobiales bacterium]|nr:TonB-dependent receptor [Longimicrobiales bacterium]